jgi:hypothetical protein
VEQRFDAAGERWSAAELDATVGRYFTDRDPERMFVASAVLAL